MLHLFNIQSVPLPVTGRGSRPLGVPASTLIRTAEGDLPVEYLSAGDMVLTRGNGLQRLLSVAAVMARDVDVVHFTPRALGRANGARPLVIPVAQQVLMHDWRARIVYGSDSILTPAASLVDGASVQRRRLKSLNLFQLHFEQPQVIWANGIKLASARTAAPVPRQCAGTRLH